MWYFQLLSWLTVAKYWKILFNKSAIANSTLGQFLSLVRSLFFKLKHPFLFYIPLPLGRKSTCTKKKKCKTQPCHLELFQAYTLLLFFKDTVCFLIWFFFTSKYNVGILTCQGEHHLYQVSANDGPRAKSWPMPVFVNKVQLEHSTIHLRMISGCFWTRMADMNSCNRDNLTHEGKNFYHWPFAENVSNPWSTLLCFNSWATFHCIII